MSAWMSISWLVETNLLYTAGDECAIAGVHSLEDQAPSIAGPSCLHFCKNPLVCPEISRVVEVDGVVKTDHHTNLWGIFPFELLAVPHSLDALYVCVVEVFLTPEFGVVHGEELLEDILVNTGL